MATEHYYNSAKRVPSNSGKQWVVRALEKIVNSVIAMPLRIEEETYMRKNCPEELFNKILEYELALCDRPDALAFAGHLQAIAYKSQDLSIKCKK